MRKTTQQSTFQRVDWPSDIAVAHGEGGWQSGIRDGASGLA